jgi:hypothetical protein
VFKAHYFINIFAEFIRPLDVENKPTLKEFCKLFSIKPFKDEAQTALFKDPDRTAQ